MSNPLAHAPFVDEATGVIRVLVECPRGSKNKYDYDEELGGMVLDRPIHSSLAYPGDYGSVPGTLSEDGDCLDALVLSTTPAFPGCLVTARVIGVLRMEDEDGPDPKLICVVSREPRTAEMRDIEDVPAHTRAELEHFFTKIKDLEPGKWAKTAGYQARAQALEEVRSSRVRFLGGGGDESGATTKPVSPPSPDPASPGKANDPPAGATEDTPSDRVPLGCITGRFQPFHREHLTYALAALERCETLLVGITNPDPSARSSDPASGHRHRGDANPFTYAERAEMARLALREAGVDPDRFRITPCPLQQPELLVHYVPPGTTHFVTTYEEEEWGHRKTTLLETAGYTVELLWRRPTKGMTSTQLRDRIRRGEGIEELVGPTVAKYLAAMPGIPARLLG